MNVRVSKTAIFAVPVCFLFAIAVNAMALSTAPDPSLSLYAFEQKDTGASLPAQAAADVIKTFAGTDGAFLAAGLEKSDYQKTSDLSQVLLYPTDQVMILKLTGAQLKDAFERSVSLYPQPNTSFLQLSGFQVTFSKSAPIGKRITNVTVNGAPINDSSSYTIAMPTSLGRGGLGYFKIWDKTNIQKTLDTTVEDVLKGKPYVATSPRWSASG